MKRLLSGLFAAARMVGLGCFAAEAEITITADRAMPVYQVGETVQFTVSADAKTKGTLSGVLNILEDNKNVLQSVPVQFSAVQSAKVAYKGEKQGFVIARLDNLTGAKPPKLNPAAGAAFEPEKLQVSTSFPADFKEFWQSGREALAGQPVTWKEIRHDGICTLYQITGPALHDQHRYGYLSVPNGKGPFPIYLWIPGAGPGVTGPSKDFDPAKVIIAALNVHSYPGASTDAEQKKLLEEYNRKLGYSYYYEGIENKDRYHFRNIILSFDRILTELAKHPKYDGKHLVLDGSSQGGGLSLMLGSFNPHVTAVAANVPACCDRLSPGGDCTRSNPLNLPWEEIKATLPYYETGNFISGMRPEVNVLMSCGFIDTTCMAHGIYAVFNRCPSLDKTMFPMPLARHAIPEEYTSFKMKWIHQRLGF